MSIKQPFQLRFQTVSNTFGAEKLYVSIIDLSVVRSVLNLPKNVNFYTNSKLTIILSISPKPSVYKSISISIYSNHCCWYQILSNPVFIFLFRHQTFIYLSQFISIYACLSIFNFIALSIYPPVSVLSIYPSRAEGDQSYMSRKINPRVMLEA